jgi:hypothetical protein
MKGARRRIVSIALLAFFLAFLPRQAWVITVQPKRETNPERSQDSAEKIIGPESVEERTADYTEALAGYTKALVVVTALLAGVSAVQIGFLIRADKTARRAADAAKSSADVAERALDQTSAPYLDVTATPRGVIHRFPGGGTSIQFMDRGVFAEYTIHNYGQSPAIVLEIYQCCIRSPGLPSTISFPPPHTNLLKTYVIGGMKASTPLTIGYPADGIDNLDSGYPIWISLQIRYRDVFRNQYISTYCAAFNPNSAAFTAIGGQKYNDRRKLTGDELKIAEARDE